jgi:hypothetical protein
MSGNHIVEAGSQEHAKCVLLASRRVPLVDARVAVWRIRVFAAARSSTLVASALTCGVRPPRITENIAKGGPRTSSERPSSGPREGGWESFVLARRHDLEIQLSNQQWGGHK